MLSGHLIPEPVTEQLCLNLGDVPVTVGGRVPKPIPEVVLELFRLSSTSPSGLVWVHDRPHKRTKAGDPVIGSLINNKYRLVHVPGHGPHYAHRIVYFLQTKENPGHMVVRHLADGDLVLGYQSDNLRDSQGVLKKPKEGYKTCRMYEYKGDTFNLTRLCKRLELNYMRIYQMTRKGRDIREVLAEHGFTDVKLLFTP
jgi:hypothetical protein